MALITFEGFDYEASGVGGDLNSNIPTAYSVPDAFNGWCGAAASPKTAGLLGGACFPSVNSSNGAIYSIPSPGAGPYIIGLRFQPNGGGFGAGSGTVWTILDSANGNQCGLGINAAGKLIFFRGTTATVVATGSQVLVSTSWYFIECQFNVSTTVGNVQVFINGNAVADINVTNQNTQATGNANAARIELFCSPAGSSSPSGLYDDFYLCDTTGGSPANTFLGVCRVETLFPTSNNSVAFTPLTSTNVSQIQEVASDGDTTYNFASASAVDTFNHGSLSSTPITVYGVIVTAKARADDVHNTQVRTKLISGGTTSNGTTNNMATIYQYMNDLYVTDPNTAAAWTGTNVNATKIGYERI